MAGSADNSDVLILGGGEGATLREVLASPDRAALHDGRHRRPGGRPLARSFCPNGPTARSRSAPARHRRRRARDQREDGAGSLRRRRFRISRNRSRIRRATSCSTKTSSTHQGALDRRRHVRAPGEHRVLFTTHRCTARWRARCSRHYRTLHRSSPTCRRSIPTGRSWHAAIASTWRRSTPPDRRLLRAAARREFLLPFGDAPPPLLVAALSAPHARRSGGYVLMSQRPLRKQGGGDHRRRFRARPRYGSGVRARRRADLRDRTPPREARRNLWADRKGRRQGLWSFRRCPRSRRALKR